jgi:hypothetical protein
MHEQEGLVGHHMHSLEHVRGNCLRMLTPGIPVLLTCVGPVVFADQAYGHGGT